MPGNRYAYDEALLGNLKILEGELVDILYENQRIQEYEVMAVVEIPYSMDKHLYDVNGVDFVLPLVNFKENTLNPVCFAISYELEEDAADNFQAAAKDYTENIDSDRGYLSKKQLKKEFSGLLNGIAALGITLSGVVALIGILNFINSTVTGIFSRKQEFAVLCSIGMTRKQLIKMLLEEGLYYLLITSGISIVLGSAISWAVLRALNQVIMFLDYQYNAWAVVTMLPVFAVISCVVPIAALTYAGKESIGERLREIQD